MTRDNALRKVRALLNTAAEGSGATDPERATAKRLAFILIDAHGLKASEWGAKPEQPTPKAPRPARPGCVIINLNGVLYEVDLGTFTQFQFSGSNTTGGGWTNNW